MCVFVFVAFWLLEAHSKYKLLLALNGDDLFACPTQLVHHWVDQVDAISDFFPILKSSRLPSPEKLQGFSSVDEFSPWLPFMVHFVLSNLQSGEEVGPVCLLRCSRFRV
jgi:hypothetical protein